MVGQRIRYYRKVKGLTQEELAQGICSVSYLSKIEKGDAKSSDEVINLLCDRLGISPNEANNDEILEMLDEWNMMMINRRSEEAEELHKNLQKKMEDILNPETILKYEVILLRYLSINEHFKEALAVINKLTPLLTELNITDRFNFYSFTSMYYYLLNDYSKSLEYIKKAEAIHAEAELQDIEKAFLYYQLALYISHTYKINSVISYCYKAMHIFDKEYIFSRSADCNILLGICNRRVRNYEQAEYHLKQALKYSKTFNDLHTESIIYHNLGYVASCKNEHKKAVEYIKKSLKNTNMFTSQRISTVFLLASECFALGSYEEAKEHVSWGLNIIGLNEKDEFYYHYKILELRLNIKTLNHSTKELENFLSKVAIPFFKKQQLLEIVARSCELLADLYFDEGLYKKASQYYRVSNETRKNIF